MNFLLYKLYKLSTTTKLIPMKSKLIKGLFILFFVTSFLSLNTCKKMEEEMLITTGTVSNIALYSAEATGTVIDIGSGAIQHGHCFEESPNVNTAGLKTTLGIPAGKGEFTSQLTGLKSGTTYYLKAYISDGRTTTYGKEISFTTLSPDLAELTTVPASSVTATTAVSGGNITSDGGATLTAR